jgi:pilus assembly protein TadC
MTAPLTLRNALWLLSTAVEIVLLVCLLRRKIRNTHRAFVIYIAGAIAQTALAAWSYLKWGIGDPVVAKTIWASQGVLLFLRFSAVYEMAERILSQYPGILTFAKSILSFIGGATVIYALLAGNKWALFYLNLDRGFELGIATFVVTLLLFARYYRLSVHSLERALAMGFCLYSCFCVINDSLFERFLTSYLNLWGYLNILTFLASLLIWLHAVRACSEIAVPRNEREVLSQGSYGTLAPELNFRLRVLNEQISRLLHLKNSGS